MIEDNELLPVIHAYQDALIDALEEIDSITEERRHDGLLIQRLIQEAEALRADPFVGVRHGVFGWTIKRMSEWDDLWEDYAAPLYEAIGAPKRKPWAGLVRYIDRATPTRRVPGGYELR